MKLVSPPGYGEVVPFDREKHGSCGYMSANNFAHMSALNAVYVNVAEFPQCIRDYPVVFSANENKGQFTPMIVTALTASKNVFVDEQGNWQDGCYVPAYARRYPFCLADLVNENTNEKQQLVCVDEAALDTQADSFFDEQGDASEQWQKFEKFLNEYEAARLTTVQFTKRLAELELFEVFEAQAFHVSGERFHMTGMYRVNEDKLKKLSAKNMKDLLEKNYLRFIYAHLLSLDNFRLLLDRTKLKGH